MIWENDLPLWKFLDDAHHNASATRSNLKEESSALANVDRVYCEMIANLNQHPEFVTGFFLIRTHSSLRAAARLCLSGECPEAYMVLRGCLESAMYGLYVAGDNGRQEIWLRRHESDACRHLVKQEFTIRSVFTCLNTKAPTTHAIARELYDRTIDNGGHPNERAITTQIRIQQSDSRVDVTANYFQCGDVPHRLCLKSAVQVGICCLDIFEPIYQSRYRILGIDERLNCIRQGF